MADLPEGWGESGWGGRTRKDGYRRNPATRFIADGDADESAGWGSAGIRDNAEEVRAALGMEGTKAEFEVDSPSSRVQGSKAGGDGDRCAGPVSFMAPRKMTGAPGSTSVV